MPLKFLFITFSLSIETTMINLKGKIGIVTGAAQGIGRAIAMEMAKVNVHVIVSDIADTIHDVVNDIKKINGSAEAMKCDVSNKKQVNELVKKVISEHGKIDILVNNAGLYPQKGFLDLDEETWKKTMAVNLDGVFYFCKAVAPHMKDKGGGKIVNIGSIAGAVVGFQQLTHYSASKGGVLGFTRALALDLAPHNIQVNVIAPGAIDTPGASSNEEQTKQIVQAIPAKRQGKPEEIGYATIFLASDKANYITGELLVVDGGWTIQ